jgi:hypothetical protein
MSALGRSMKCLKSSSGNGSSPNIEGSCRAPRSLGGQRASHRVRPGQRVSLAHRLHIDWGEDLIRLAEYMLALGAVAFIFCGDWLVAWYLGLGLP